MVGIPILSDRLLEELDPGDPVGDGLILEKGILKREIKEPSEELLAVCRDDS